MVKLARVSIVFSLVLSAAAFAQDAPTYTTNYSFRLWEEGEYPSGDSVQANWNELDSILNTKLTSDGSSTGDLMVYTVPWIGTTAAGWLGADNRVSFFPFTVTATFTPDSVYMFARSNGNTADTLYMSIHSFDGATQYCMSKAMLADATASNTWYRAGFATTAELLPGTYLCAFASPNMVAASPLPTIGLMYAAAADEFYLTGANSIIGGTRRVGSINSALTNGSIQANLQTSAGAYTPTGFPLFIVLGQ